MLDENWISNEIVNLKKKQPNVAEITQNWFITTRDIILANSPDEDDQDVWVTIFSKLLNHEIVVPITADDEWVFVTSDTDHNEIYYCKRYPQLLKMKGADGIPQYRDTARQFCIDINNLEKGPLKSPIAEAIFNEIFPISFPYEPLNSGKAYKIFIETLNYYEKDISDTLGVLYIQSPSGMLTEVKRFFKGNKSSLYQEIDQREYFVRRKKAMDREKKEKK